MKIELGRSVDEKLSCFHPLDAADPFAPAERGRQIRQPGIQRDAGFLLASHPTARRGGSSAAPSVRGRRRPTPAV